MPQPYPGEPGGPNRKPSWNGLAVAGFILSIFGSCIGLILSIIGLNQAKKRGERGAGLAIAGICISVILTVAFIGFRPYLYSNAAHRDSTGVVRSPGQISTLKLNVGDCFDQPSGINSTSGITVNQVKAIPCSSPHDAEVFGEIQLSYTTYPGESTITRDTETICTTKFATFVGRDYSKSELGMTYFYPTESAWDRGVRAAQCMIGEASGKTTVTTLAGAAR